MPSVNPAKQQRILVVDDDGHIREVVCFALQTAGYDVLQAADGRSAWTSFGTSPDHFDLVLLDIVMPGLDGLDLCRRIRERSRVPLIFLSSRDEELDRILGLELGADDYVTKPFSPRELVARVKACLRRYAELQALLQHLDDDGSSSTLRRGEGDVPLRHGPLWMSVGRHECKVGALPVVLTVSEFSLLRALLACPGRVLTRRQLVERAYGGEHYLSDRTVDSHVRRIRQKLKAAGYDGPETVYGVGYRIPEAG